MHTSVYTGTRYWLSFALALGITALGISSCNTSNGSNSDDEKSQTDSTSSFTRNGENWQITANGTPLHKLDTSKFPNQWKKQNYSLTLDATPTASGSGRTELSSEFPKAFGITLDGVKLDPLTAECYDANGDKTDPRSGGGCANRLDALQTIRALGFDEYFGHVQPNSGAYHYHAYSADAAKAIYKHYKGNEPASNVDLVLVGIARDGFPILFSLKDSYTSGYTIKNGLTRKDFDKKTSGGNPGVYVGDYEHTGSGGANVLGTCNQTTLSNIASYNYPNLGVDSAINQAYIITGRFKSDGKTPNFPAIPHCFIGGLSSSDGF